jgi:type IV secretion system protein VirB1
LLGLLALAAACAPTVAPATMVAVVRQESGADPWRIGVNDGPPPLHQPRNRDEAVATARILLVGGYNIDLGLAQINSANLGWLGLSLPDAFEPCANLRAAAVVLTACYERALADHRAGQPALQAALSCYNTNSLSQGFANGYVQRVVSGSTAFVPAIDPAYPVPAPPRRRGGDGSLVLRPHGAADAPRPVRWGKVLLLYGRRSAR